MTALLAIDWEEKEMVKRLVLLVLGAVLRLGACNLVQTCSSLLV